MREQDRDRWSKIQRIYHEALPQTAASRVRFLEHACADDPELRRELESLLDCHSEAEPFIAVPAFDVMAAALAEYTADRVVPVEVRRIRDVFAAALERPTAERLQFLERACAMLVAEAERMLPEARGPLMREVSSGPTQSGAITGPSGRLEISESDRFCRACGSPVAAATPGDGRFRPGTLFAGRFRIAGVIGRGGMGEVYRAEDLELGQTVALKFLASVRSDTGARVRLRTEVRLARQISHPNVCRVYDIGEAQGDLYLSMEYVDGEDLAALLKRIGRVPVDKGIDVAHKIAGGLAAAHAKGVLHRDLKPRNVMIDGLGEVRVMDFGLATVATELSGADVRSGTPAYMAPEQLAGREATTASDIYAFGLVLYELFTGKRPFDVTDTRELLRRREQEQPVPPTTLLDDLPITIEQVILRCLDPDPQKRPASALGMMADLRWRAAVEAVAKSDSGARQPAAEAAADAAVVDAPAHVLSRQKWRRVATLAALGLTAALATSAALATFVLPSPFGTGKTSKLTEQDVVVLAEFENRTDDP